MLELLEMWAMLEALGIIFLPLTITIFHNLPDRGWAFSKAIGLAVLAFCVWLPLVCLQFLPFSRLFIFGVFLLLVALNVLGFLRVRKTLLKVISSHFVYILATELIFFGMMFLLGLLRSYDPSIRNYEMFMDEGFLAVIMRSPHLPPNDMWYAGQAINYYYYAHYNIGMLAKLLGQVPSVAFNTGICMFFGLTAVNLFGVTSNIVAWAQHRRRHRQSDSARNQRPDRVLPAMAGAIPFGILTILLGLVLGNLAATQTWWQSHGDLPDYYWFNASRVVINTINEFPAFSFLLSCFHAHVLTLAFTILGIGLIFNLFLEAKGQGFSAFGRGWRMPLTLVMTAIVIGSLYAMNGWDYPTYLALGLVCLVLQQWLAHGSRFSWDLVLDVFTVCAALGALSFFLFAPFYLNFVSPAQGLGLVMASDRTPLADELLIYGVFAFIFISFLLASFFHRRPVSRVVAAAAAVQGTTSVLSPEESGALASEPESAPVALTQVQQAPAEATPLLASAQSEVQVFVDEDEQVSVTDLDVVTDEEEHKTAPLSSPGFGWRDPRFIGLVVTLVVAIGCLLILKNSVTFVVTGGLAAMGAILVLYHLKDRERSFVLLLGAVACALVAFCEIIFLKDVFVDQVPRMNTVFKFYFQAWALLSIVGGAGVYFVLDALRPVLTLPRSSRQMYSLSRVAWFVALLAVLALGAVYPLTAPAQRYSDFTQRDTSLNGLDYMASYDPPDYAAINWINSHITGDPVMVEAIGADYSDYGRISIFTGLPTIMNWEGHEWQWRVNWVNKGTNSADFFQRPNDVKSIYTDTSQQDVLNLMARYNAQYLYVGPLEQVTYVGANLQRFGSFMHIVYQQDGVTIYQVP
jgi:YYY domain-containing protein